MVASSRELPASATAQPRYTAHEAKVATAIILAMVQSNANGHNARAALEMILATYQSHIAGHRVTRPLANRTHPLTRWP